MAQKIAYGVSGVTLVGTDTNPLALSVSGGATHIATWTHNVGVRAEKVEVLTQTNHARIADTLVTVTQPSVNSIVITNAQAGATFSGIIRVTWASKEVELTQPVAYNDASIVLS